jgi:hypothetical protein
MTILKKSAQKAGMIMVVCAKLIDKASTRTYTATTAFATIVFTMQTIALAAQDSLGGILRQDFPHIHEWMQFFQAALNPDQETPEKCATTPFNIPSAVVLLAFGWSCLNLITLHPCSRLACASMQRDWSSAIHAHSCGCCAGVCLPEACIQTSSWRQ